MYVYLYEWIKGTPCVIIHPDDAAVSQETIVI